MKLDTSSRRQSPDLGSKRRRGRRARSLGGVVVVVAVAGLGWLLRRGRRGEAGRSLLGRVIGFWVRAVYRPFSERALQFDLERARRGIDRARFLRPPAGITVEGFRIGEVPAEWVTPERTAAGRHLLYLHGGGFMMGGLSSHRHWVGSLAQAFHARTLHLEYRLAPEFPYPASLDDCVAGYRLMLANGVDPQNLILAGESAGGGLVISTMLRAREQGLPLPCAAVCISGTYDFTFSGSSHTRNVRSDYLEARGLHSMERLYLAGHDPADPLVSSIFADLTGFPPLYLVAGGAELLLSDTELLASRARECGVDVTLRIFPGMLHAFPVMLFLPESRRVRREMKDFVEQHAREAQGQTKPDAGFTPRATASAGTPSSLDRPNRSLDPPDRREKGQ